LELRVSSNIVNQINKSERSSRILSIGSINIDGLTNSRLSTIEMGDVFDMQQMVANTVKQSIDLMNGLKRDTGKFISGNKLNIVLKKIQNNAKEDKEVKE
jgi:hypothetical protein